MFVSVTIIRTYNFTAKMIHLGMWLWCVFRALKPKKTFNHCEVRYGELTSGAIAEGVKTRPWAYYVHGIKKMQWENYCLELTEEQLRKGLAYLETAEGSPYEFENFWWHLVKIITGKWKGSKTTRQTYCYEHGIRFLNATGKYDLDPFMNPYEFNVWADTNLLTNN